MSRRGHRKSRPPEVLSEAVVWGLVACGVACGVMVWSGLPLDRVALVGLALPLLVLLPLAVLKGTGTRLGHLETLDDPHRPAPQATAGRATSWWPDTDTPVSGPPTVPAPAPEPQPYAGPDVPGHAPVPAADDPPPATPVPGPPPAESFATWAPPAPASWDVPPSAPPPSAPPPSPSGAPAAAPWAWDQPWQHPPGPASGLGEPAPAPAPPGPAPSGPPPYAPAAWGDADPVGPERGRP